MADSIQGVLERHQKMQDEIAEDMIRMARSLKDNSLIAKDIIIGDNKVRGKNSHTRSQPLTVFTTRLGLNLRPFFADFVATLRTPVSLTVPAQTMELLSHTFITSHVPPSPTGSQACG